MKKKNVRSIAEFGKKINEKELQLVKGGMANNHCMWLKLTLSSGQQVDIYVCPEG